MFVRRNFRWRFKPIGEIFRFFPKYNDIYLLRRMIFEIFSAFGRKKLDPPHPPPVMINVAIVAGNAT